MSIYDRNIQVFADTRAQSHDKYAAETENMLCGVKVYTEPAELVVEPYYGLQEVMFENRSTIAAAVWLNSVIKERHKIGILNFADALVPGGLVETGEVTQEESICRCSNLYEGLILNRCMQQYYGYNRSTGNSVYSDRLIYSPNVLIFKHDSSHTAVKRPFYVDVITCPAPSCKCSEDILIHRIQGIINSAAANGVTDIVLGAWGCGAFGQDAKTIGRCFGTVLKDCNYFRNVCFAIISVVQATDAGNDYYFQEGFREVCDY